MTDRNVRRWWRIAGIVTLVAVSAACSARQTTPPAGTAQPDRFLFERGTEAMKMEEWLNARTYFQQIVDGYPQSPFRPDAKLGVGDAYLGEGNAESAILAANEFREFLQFYPTNPRADYAQYKLAMSHFQQMRAADRDQTETKAALAEFDVFFQKFPNSPLTPEVKQNWRIARDRLSESSYRIGMTYYRIRWNPGAIERFREVLRDDPGFTGRDGVYFYLAESLARTDKTPEAIPYFERLLEEFDQSDYLEDARVRLEELKNQ
jgi:outer membrane protein assembly factor BamD